MFVRYYGSTPWVGKDGYPKSWMHFRLGMDHLLRERARGMIENFDATRMSSVVKKEDVDRWLEVQRRLADW